MNTKIIYKNEDEMWCCTICKVKIKCKSSHIKTANHQRNLLNQKAVQPVEEETIEVKTPKKLFKIVIQTKYNQFKEKVEKLLEEGWKLHGYTQHPLQTSKSSDNVYVSFNKGQWSQAFTKNVF